MLEKVNVSSYHFIRLFKRYTGVSPYAYLTSVRLDNSRSMLLRTNNSIAQIAADCGFNDTGSLIKHFKAKFKKTPLQFRNGFKSKK